MMRIVFVVAVAASALTCASAATAMPTMIRLGYANCAVCHVSPQGGGLLTEYGRSIDEAQSLRGGEYRPSQNRLVTLLRARGAIVQDLRAVFVQQRAWTSHAPGTSVFRPRLQYRNLTSFGSTFRVSAVVSAETEFVPRPALRYDPPAMPSSLIVNTALVHYKPSESPAGQKCCK